MGEIKNPVITICNLGPIKRGQIELKPLNIFIGGHNTGKSYAAQMIYSMARVLRGSYRRSTNIEGPKKSENRSFVRELRNLDKSIRRGGKIGFGEMGATLQKQGLHWWTRWEELSEEEMISSLKQYYMCKDIRELVRFNGKFVNCGITFYAAGEDGVMVGLRVGKKSGKIKVNIEVPSIKTLSMGMRGVAPLSDYFDFQFALIIAWRELWKGVADSNSYYLPAARSGILQLWDMVQLYTLENLPEQFGLPGLVRDFLGDVVRSGVDWGRGAEKRVRPLLEMLEDEILHGEIVIERERPGPLRIDYIFGDGASLSIQRASSMVAELAPLDLWIKGVLNKGDLLIIEEPEAHLHPSSQMQIARLIARLVNSGVRIICTTHSPLLVHRISNLMLAGKTNEKVRADIGLKEIDIVKEDDLAVYQFVATKDGSRVRKLKMIKKFGIPEDEFLREYEKVSLESYKVSS